MALTEKKIEIVEAYLIMKCKNKGLAVKSVDPTIKNHNAYAWKVFNEIEVKDYLAKRRRETLLGTDLDLKKITKALTKNIYSSLGLADRTILAHGKDGFDTITGKYENSGDVKNYWGVLRDILGSEISAVIALEELKEDKAHEIKLKNLDINKERNAIEKEKLKNKCGNNNGNEIVDVE